MFNLIDSVEVFAIYFMVKHFIVVIVFTKERHYHHLSLEARDGQTALPRTYSVLASAYSRRGYGVLQIGKDYEYGSGVM